MTMKPPTINDICDSAQAAIGVQDKTHFVQRIINKLRDPRYGETEQPLVGMALINYQAQHIMALGTCFQDGRHCPKDKPFGDMLVQEALSRSRGRDRNRMKRIAEPSPLTVISLNSRRAILAQPR